MGPWRRGRVVRAARLWCRKSPYRVSSRLGCEHAATGKLSLSTQQKMGTFFELGKDKAAKGEGWAKFTLKQNVIFCRCLLVEIKIALKIRLIIVCITHKMNMVVKSC